MKDGSKSEGFTALRNEVQHVKLPRWRHLIAAKAPGSRSDAFTALRSGAEHDQVRRWAQPLAEKPKGAERSEGGFTLVELLVVISIIGILSTTILVSLQGTRAKARDSRRLTDIRQLQSAIELYRDGSRGKAPPDLGCLVGQGAGCAGNSFIGSIPTDPFTGANYPYFRSAGSGTFDLAKYVIQAEFETSTALGPAGIYCFTSIDYSIKQTPCTQGDAK